MEVAAKREAPGDRVCVCLARVRRAAARARRGACGACGGSAHALLARVTDWPTLGILASTPHAFPRLSAVRLFHRVVWS